MSHPRVPDPRDKIHPAPVVEAAWGLKAEERKVAHKVSSLFCEGRQGPDELRETSNIREKG